MSRSFPHWLRWNRLVPLALGTLAILGMLSLDTSVRAQAKKEATKDSKDAKDSKAKSDDNDAKEEKKEVVVPRREPVIPSIVDQMITRDGAAQVAKINELIKANWIANKVQPSERCTDYEFIRRASLDIIGRIATEKEITEFMNQSAPTRRAWLIERLLAVPKKDQVSEYADNFANIWTVMLLTRTGSKKMYQEQLHEWLAQQFDAVEGYAPKTEPKASPSGTDPKAPPRRATGGPGAADWSKITIALLSATGKTNENAAVNFVAHHLGMENRDENTKRGPTPEELRESGKYDMVPVTSRTTRLFLGVRTQCVQCHDHPFNGDLMQDQFWGINAFFRQATVSQRPAMMGAKKNKKDIGDPQIELRDDPTYNEKGIVSFERRSGLLKYTGMKFIDLERVKTIPENSTRRLELANRIVKSPYFSKVFVNRTWGHFFGKSMTRDAVDDFGEHNPFTNEELLNYLAEEFKATDHNPRELIRWICNSQAYGLSSKSNKGNDRPDDEFYFARMLQKSLSPEQLFESLMTATANKIADDKTQKIALREKWLDSLVLNFGNDEGEEGSFSGTVVQALMLMNGDDINKAITDQQVGTVANVLTQMKKSTGLRITQPLLNKLYMAALNRPVTSAEFAKISDPKMIAFYGSKVNPNTEAFAVAYYQDIMWALLNSNEFILNH